MPTWHQTPMVQVATERCRQQYIKSASSDKKAVYLDLLGRKIFISSSLHFCIANGQVLLAKYNYFNYSEFLEFVDKQPQQNRAHFQALIDEGKQVARPALQSSVDAAGTSVMSMAAVIAMHRESWLHALGFPREVQDTMEGLALW